MNLHSSQEPVAESLEASSTGGAPSAPSKSTTTVGGFSCSVRMTVALNHSQSGTTLQHSTGDLGLDAWILSLAASRAKTSAQQEKAQASAANDQDSGQKWPGLLAKYDRDASLWKTAQCSLFEDSEPSLEIWPRWGSMRNGVAYQRQKPAHLTSGTGCGLWVTPCAQDAKPITGGNLYQTSTGSVRHMRPNGISSNRGLEAQVMWQTPTVQDANGRDRHNQRNGTVRPSLLGQARVWPTATATAYKGWSPNHNRANTDDRLDYTVERESFRPGQKTPPMRLNPTWVEKLMGWPDSWTAVNPISRVKMCFWFMGFCRDEETGREQVLRVLREGNVTQ